MVTADCGWFFLEWQKSLNEKSKSKEKSGENICNLAGYEITASYYKEFLKVTKIFNWRHGWTASAAETWGGRIQRTETSTTHQGRLFLASSAGHQDSRTGAWSRQTHGASPRLPTARTGSCRRGTLQEAPTFCEQLSPRHVPATSCTESCRDQLPRGWKLSREFSNLRVIELRLRKGYTLGVRANLT